MARSDEETSSLEQVHEKRGRLPRARALIATVLAMTMAALLPAWAVVPSTVVRHSVSLGFEDVTNVAALPMLTQRLRDVRANAVSLSAGRVEWPSTLWPDTPIEGAPRWGNRDPLNEAVGALRRGRELTISVDALAPRLISEGKVPAASIHAGGKSTSVPRLREHKEYLAKYVGYLAERFRPDYVALTELFVEDPDLTHEQRIEELTDVVRVCNEAAERWGVKLAVDVRVNAVDPTAGRPDSGQDYDQLASLGVRLILWVYTGVPGVDGATLDPSAVEAFGQQLEDRWPGQLEFSVGLWGPDDRAVDPAAFKETLLALRTAEVTLIAVTPVSLMSDAHWRALRGVWRG